MITKRIKSPSGYPNNQMRTKGRWASKRVPVEVVVNLAVDFIEDQNVPNPQNRITAKRKILASPTNHD